MARLPVPTRAPAPYRRYGVVLRAWRQSHRVAVSVAARRFECTQSFISHLEAGGFALPGHSPILPRMLHHCPAAPGAIPAEQFFWHMSNGSLSLLHSAARVTLGAMGGAMAMGGKQVPVPLGSLVDAQWPAGGSAEAVDGGMTALYGGAWDVYMWPRAVLVDFLMETTEEWRWLFCSSSQPEGLFDGMITITLRPSILSFLPVQRAAALRLRPPSVPLTQYVSSPPRAPNTE